jgi:GT2 family glycosyltransferase
VIICAYTEERWSELLAAVESIRRQSMPAREIILVIDHNTSLCEQVRTHLSGVVVTENSRPRGLSGARNSGVALARSTLIAFLDDDAIAESDCLERLNESCQDPNVLGAGGFVKPLWMGKKPAWFPHEFYWVVGCSYQNQLRVLTEIRNPYGCCACIRREVFETVGGFRDGIGRVGKRPLGGEETELCIRAAQYWPHKRFLYDPQAQIYHHIPPARACWRYFLARCYAEGISKATISWLVGTRDSLASERAYILLALPKGVARGLRDGFCKLDPTGFLRAGAIVTGLITTAAGYLVGKVSLSRVIRKEAQSGGAEREFDITRIEEVASAGQPRGSLVGRMGE